VTHRRTRVAEGVYQDAYGFAAVIKLRGVQREKRFPPSTPVDTMKSWRIQTRAELDVERPARVIAVRGTLESDGDRFLTRKRGTIGYKAERAHLHAWYPRFGALRRSAITAEAVREQIARWRSQSAAARTIRHRCRVLRACYVALDGERVRHPLVGVALPKLPQSDPVAVPIAILRDVARRLKASGRPEVYARFLVRATTGQRPAQIMRAQPGDLDLKRRIWFVRAAKGGNPVALPLNDDAVNAWTVFAAANAWGPFDTGRDADVLRAHGWPEGIRPYACRHTFAIDLLLSGAADLGDLQGLLGHKQIQTTRNFYAPVLVARLAKAVRTRRLKLA
jgi:integrase